MWCIASAKGGYVFGRDGLSVRQYDYLQSNEWIYMRLFIRGASRAKKRSIKFGNDPV